MISGKLHGFLRSTKGVEVEMCGRFTNEFTWAELHALDSVSDELFPMGPPSNMQPRFNIAPTQDADFISLNKSGTKELQTGRWWLVPFWAKELPKAAMFNARIETVDTSPAFRDAFKSRRCLIPADAYFEWTTSPIDGKKARGCGICQSTAASASLAFGRTTTTSA